MERTSEGEPLYVPAKDGRILVLRKWKGDERRVVLFIPGNAAQSLLFASMARDAAGLGTMYLLEPSGHGHSEGEWSAELHRSDISHVISLIPCKSLCAVAAGHGAQMMLDASALRGVVLLDMEALPPIAPVRLRVPAVVLVKRHDLALLKRLFGPVRVFALGEHPVPLKQRHMVLRALKELLTAEKPFRTS